MPWQKGQSGNESGLNKNGERSPSNASIKSALKKATKEGIENMQEYIDQCKLLQNNLALEVKLLDSLIEMEQQAEEVDNKKLAGYVTRSNNITKQITHYSKEIVRVSEIILKHTCGFITAEDRKKGEGKKPEKPESKKPASFSPVAVPK